MRKITHTLGGALVGVFVSSSVADGGGVDTLVLSGVIFGSVLPDWLEPARDWTHRRTFHSLLLWLALSAALLPYGPYVYAPAVGALVHVLMDSLTKAGVPLMPFVSSNMSVGLRFIRSGGVGDHVLQILLSVLLILFFVSRAFFYDFSVFFDWVMKKIPDQKEFIKFFVLLL